MHEEQFIRLPSQGNIYSTTRLGNISLIGSGNYGKIFAQTKKMELEELTLPQLPGNIDIIGLDAWDEPFPILGITYVDTGHSTLEDETKQAFLHIFSSLPSSVVQTGKETESGDGDFDDSSRDVLISQNISHTDETVSTFTYSRSIQNPKIKKKEEFILKQLQVFGTNQSSSALKLNFIPYHLYHVLAQKADGNMCTMFLLSGSDNRIHMYEPIIDEKTDTVSFSEAPIRNYFPELPSKFDSIVTRIAVDFLTNARKRVTICGCEDGTLRAYIVSDSCWPKWIPKMDESIDSESSTTELNSTPMTSLHEDVTDKEKILKLISSTSSEANSQHQQDDDIIRVVNFYDGMITSVQFFKDGSNLNAVVSSSASPVYHYTDILEDKFKTGKCLKFSSKWDSVEVICVADIDFDGKDEIIIGTFGCTLLVYKYLDDIKNWAIVSHRKFPNAIFSISFFDFHLHVVTAGGLHIMEFSDSAYFLKYGLIVSTTNTEQHQQLKTGDDLATSVQDMKLSTD